MKWSIIVDIGNQDTVVGSFDQNGEVLFTARIPTHRRTASEVEQWVNFLFLKYHLDPAKIQGLAVASVVPQVNDIWNQVSQEFFKRDAFMVNHRTVTDWLKLEVDYPDEVGPDRLANSVAARFIFPNHSAIILDFGTATTFDVVHKEGHYCGGIISPGLGLAVESLGKTAALLPRISVKKMDYVVGRNTVDAMTSGAYWGYIAMVDGLLEKIILEQSQQGQNDFKLLATGGWAPLICKGLKNQDIIVDSHLTLKGIYYVTRKPE